MVTPPCWAGCGESLGVGSERRRNNDPLPTEYGMMGLERQQPNQQTP